MRARGRDAEQGHGNIKGYSHGWQEVRMDGASTVLKEKCTGRAAGGSLPNRLSLHRPHTAAESPAHTRHVVQPDVMAASVNCQLTESIIA